MRTSSTCDHAWSSYRKSRVPRSRETNTLSVRYDSNLNSHILYKVEKLKTDNIKLNSDLKIMRNDHSELLHAVFSLEKKVELLHKENQALKEAQISSAAVAAQAVAAAANPPRRVQIS